MARLLLLFLAIPALVFAKTKRAKEIPFIYLNTNQVLNITVIDNLFDEIGESDRYYHIEETLQEVLRKTEFPMAWKIDRFGARVPKDQPELQLVIHRWGYNGLGEIEVLLSASLKEAAFGGNRNKLGFFRLAEGGYPLRIRTIENHNEVMRKALFKLMAELNQHFEVKVTDPDLLVEPPSPGFRGPSGD